MLTPVTKVCSSEYRIRDQKNADALLQKAEVKRITDIFSEGAYRSIPQWCKELKKDPEIIHIGIGYNDILLGHITGQEYDPIQFDQNHKMTDPEAYFSLGGERYSYGMKEFIMAMIERFAREMELVGCHELSVFMYRSNYNPSSNMAYFQLDWHFDKSAKCTMVSVLQNDFPYAEEGEGLDIAENSEEGPHLPKSYRDSYPKDGYMSCSYPENGAIIFHTHQGTIIHRRSVLDKPTSSNATRTLLQIKLKDPNWI